MLWAADPTRVTQDNTRSFFFFLKALYLILLIFDREICSYNRDRSQNIVIVWSTLGVLLELKNIAFSPSRKYSWTASCHGH